MKIEITPNQKLFDSLAEEVSFERALHSLLKAYRVKEPEVVADQVLQLIEESS